jgi:tetratricopeptide (TPR) repeat protein
MYRRHIQQDEARKDPGRLLAYAAFLGRQNRGGEALDYCKKALKKAPALAVLEVALGVLRAGQVTDAQEKRVEKWLKKALANHPRSTPFLLCLANLRDYQGDYLGAIAIYRQILRTNSDNILARNNLAWLLALKKGTGEAWEQIQEVIKRVGPLPELLDTRAVIYLTLHEKDIKNPDKAKKNLAKKNLAKAIEDLQNCLNQSSPLSSSTANRYFHLARAYWLTEDLTKARLAYYKATKAGLRPSRLHPLERPIYRKLNNKFGR